MQPAPFVPPGVAVPGADAINAIAPTGVLRAGINIGNFLLVSGTGSDGEPEGVSPSMAAALADLLGVPLDLVTFASPGELADAVIADRWDIANIGADPARADHIAFTSPYCEIDSTYLVRGDSPIVVVADVDRPGVRIVTKERAAYTLWLERHIVNAELIRINVREDSLDTFVAQGLEVLAGLRPRLLRDAERLPGSRVLDGRFTAVRQAIGTPRARDGAGIAYLERFVAAAVESGFVAALIDHHGATGLTVARN